MEDRFDRLEQKLDQKFAEVDRKFDGIDQKFVEVGGKFDGLESRLGERIDGVEQKLSGVELRLRGHIEDVDAHLSGGITAVDQKVDALSQKVGVLHEDVKSDFRFSLEARDGLKEQVDRRFIEQQEFIQKALAPLEDAIRRANEQREREAL